MNFELTAEQQLIQDTGRRFAAEEIAPTLEEEERKHEFRADRVAKMGELGFFSCALPEELGGSGMGFMESVLIAEQIARVSASWRLPFNMQNLGPALTVAKFGTGEQRKKYVPGWVAGTQLGFFAMTEPNTGSDVASMRTHAIDRGDHWEIHGNKMWISQAQVGDAGLLYAYTDKEKGNKGMTAFIIEPKKMKGCTARPIETKLGLHCAPTGEFVFEGMQVPKENVLGKPGDGFRICMWQLNQTRLGCAAGALASVLAYWGQDVDIDELAEELPAVGKGVLSVDLLIEARERGFDARIVTGSLDYLEAAIRDGEPLILMLRIVDAPLERADLYHYVVVDGVDGATGLIRLNFGNGSAEWGELAKIRRAWEATDNFVLHIRPE